MGTDISIRSRSGATALDCALSSLLMARWGEINSEEVATRFTRLLIDLGWDTAAAKEFIDAQSSVIEYERALTDRMIIKRTLTGQTMIKRARASRLDNFRSKRARDQDDRSRRPDKPIHKKIKAGSR